MLGIILRPLPLEPIPHWLARHIRLLGIPNCGTFIEYLTGRRHWGFSYDLPTRLSLLTEKLPLEPYFSADDLIEQHTLFPFYSRFLSEERKKRLCHRMKFEAGGGIHLLTGVISSDVSMLTLYRICTVCIGEDRQSFGGAYFHLEHQLPGITVCPHHGSNLIETNISLKKSKNFCMLFTAEDALYHLQEDCKNNFPVGTTNIIWQLAQDALWLLQNPKPSPDPNWIKQRYLQLLQERDLASLTKGEVNTKDLLHQFQSIYSPDVLTAIGCSLNTISEHNWLARITRPSALVQHPIYHLLLMQFLGVSAEAFFLEKNFFAPFGDGLWPCLNKPCSFYKQKVIQKVEIHRNYKRHLVGVFSCPNCDFKYSRTGADRSEEDLYRCDRIVDYGLLWDSILIENWNETSISLQELANKLGVHPSVVKRQAIRLKLVSDDLNVPAAVISNEVKNLSITLVDEKRKLWLLHIKNNSSLGITKLHKLEPSLYSWLYRCDRHWLQAHSPREPNPRYVTSRQIDWAMRDIEVAVTCIRSIINSIDTNKKPVHLSKTSISQTSHYSVTHIKSAEKLPISTNLIGRFTESHQDFAIRRIWWAAQKWHREQSGILSRRSLIRFSGSEHLLKCAVVAYNFDEALNWTNDTVSKDAGYVLPNRTGEFFQALLQSANAWV